MAENNAEQKSWKIEIITWNVASLAPTPNFDIGRVFSEENFFDADLIAVGLQEVDYYPARYLSSLMTVREELWTGRFRAYLGERGYVKLSCGWTAPPRLMGVLLLVFVSQRRMENIRRVETKFCKTGFSGYSSHKGAVGVRLTLADGSHVTFLCAHFAPTHEALAYRIKEYHWVLNAIQFGSKNVISDDYVFWLGDLNFRVEGFPVEESIRLIEHNYIEKLLEYDQLTRCMNSQRAFYHFHEHTITFKPTYKFLIDTSDYDARRSPSWCDRILWRVESTHKDAERQLECHPVSYTSRHSVTCSDHKPVTAEFKIRVFSMDTPPLISIRYPSAFGTWFVEQNNLCQYVVSKHYTPGMFDWIGIFKPGFTSDEQVVNWAYTVTSWEESKTADGDILTNVLFKKQNIPSPGTYILGYYSRDRSCLISMSSEFEIANGTVETAMEAQEEI